MFMNAKKEQHFSAIWPDLSALTGSVVCIEMEIIFFILSLELLIASINVGNVLIWF